ncbi:MAG: acetyl-CoA carboxylase carboxyltransferase subunit alpha [Bacillota bacterium]
MNNLLEFERPVIALEEKIRELEALADENGMDLSEEIAILNIKLEDMKKHVYKSLTPWQKVKISRLPERPTTLEYIDRMISDFIEFHGDRLYGDDCAIVGGIGALEGIPVTVIGHQKGKDTKENIKRNFGMPHPEGYRKALRLMKQAEKFHRPIIMFIDTPGAYCGIGAEERGQGEAIATNLWEMCRLKTPIIVVVIGEGGSGGALALGIGDKVCMLEHSIYSVISPEGLSSILWKDASLAERAAEMMKLTAQDLLQMNIIDGIIEEPLGGAHKSIEIVSKQIKNYVVKELKELLKLNTDTLLQTRYSKIRKIGQWEEDNAVS